MYLKNELLGLIRSDENIFDFIQNNSMDGLWFWDLENPENVWINARLWTLLGYDPDEMPHNLIAWQSIINQDDLKVANENFVKCFEDPNHPYDQLLRYTLKNGSTKWIRCRGLVIRNKDGKPVRMLGTHQDVTNITNNEYGFMEAIEIANKSEIQFRNLFENAADAIFIADKETGIIIDANKAAEKLTQLEHDEIVGMHQTKLHPPFVVQYSADSFRHHQKLTEEYKFTTPIEITVIRKDGTEVPVEILAAKVEYKDKNCLVGNFRDISERRQAERLLQEKNEEIASQNEALNIANLELIAAKDKVEESEFKLKEAQQIAHVGNWELSILTNTLLWSDEIFRIFDCEPHEFESTYEAFLKFIHPDDREMVNSAYLKSLELKEEYHIEHRLLTKNNRIKYVREKCITTFDEQGKPLTSFGIVMDITEQKRIEIELAESTERFKALHNASFGGIAIHDKGKILECNQGLSEMTGYSLEELLRMDGLLLIAPEDREMVRNKIVTGYEKPYEAIGLRKNGERFPMRLEARNIPYKGKNVRTVEFRDITESKQAEQQIISAKEKAEESKERYRSLLDNLEAGIVVHAPDTSIVLNNPKASELLGLSEDQMKGKTARDEAWKFINENFLSLHIDEYPVNRIIYSKKPIKNQILGIVKFDKSDITWVTVNGFPKLDNAGNITEIVISIIDITEKKKSEIEIRDMNETLEKRIAERTHQLETINKELTFHLSELEQFSYVSNHDLQEPLRTLVQFSQLIKDNYSGMLDEEGNTYIDFISKAALRMKELVKDLLEYTLLGKESAINTVDCNTIVKAVLIDLDGSIKKSNARIVVRELPTVMGYDTELRLLFQNLIENAIKYQKTGNIPEINISAESHNNDWLFKISDNGIGFDEKYKDKVFILFQRLHNRSEYEGTGIGLSHCKKIVELHGGRIWVESKIDKGSTFSFTIPKI